MLLILILKSLTLLALCFIITYSRSVNIVSASFSQSIRHKALSCVLALEFMYAVSIAVVAGPSTLPSNPNVYKVMFTLFFKIGAICKGCSSGATTYLSKDLQHKDFLKYFYFFHLPYCLYLTGIVSNMLN